MSVDMALYQVPVQQPVGGCWELEVDAGANFQRAEVGPPKRFRDDIREKCVARFLDDSEAATVDRNAGSTLESTRGRGMVDPDPGRIGFDHHPDCANYPGEHRRIR